MRKNIVLKMAFLNLRQGRMRSAVTIVGVVIGIGSIIFLVSLGFGLEKLVTKQVTQFQEFTYIDVPSTSVKTQRIDQTVVERIKQTPHILVTGRIATMGGRVKQSDSDLATEVIVLGADDSYWSLTGQQLTLGALPKTNTDIVVNESLMNILGVTQENVIGTKISLDVLIPKELMQESEAMKEVIDLPFTVVGAINEGDSPLVYFNLDTLIASGVSNFSSLKIKVDNQDSVPIVRNQLENIGLNTEYVGDTVSQITQVFSFFRIVLGAFGLIALIVASLGTFNVLTVNLLERTKEVGLMKALGMRKRDIYLIFMAEAFLISLIGGLVGLGAGVALGNFGNYMLKMAAMRSGAEVVQIFYTPLVFSVGCALFSLAVGFMTGWYPARRAVRINAIDALRFE